MYIYPIRLKFSDWARLSPTDLFVATQRDPTDNRIESDYNKRIISKRRYTCSAAYASERAPFMEPMQITSTLERNAIKTRHGHGWVEKFFNFGGLGEKSVHDFIHAPSLNFEKH